MVDAMTTKPTAAWLLMVMLGSSSAPPPGLRAPGAPAAPPGRNPCPAHSAPAVTVPVAIIQRTREDQSIGPSAGMRSASPSCSPGCAASSCCSRAPASSVRLATASVTPTTSLRFADISTHSAGQAVAARAAVRRGMQLRACGASQSRAACGLALLTERRSAAAAPLTLFVVEEQHGAKARLLRPDLITLDLLLPGRTGWQILRDLKQMPETRDIPVLVISVLDEDKAALTLGAAAYLRKPLKKEALLRAVRENLPGRVGSII